MFRIRAIAALALLVAVMVAAPAGAAPLRTDSPAQREAATRRPALPVASPGNGGWLDASIIVALMLFAGTTMVGVRVQQRSLPG